MRPPPSPFLLPHYSELVSALGCYRPLLLLVLPLLPCSLPYPLLAFDFCFPRSLVAIDPNNTVKDNDDIGVKSSGPSYNVWSDDWSE